jgi:hypothetical protein
MYIRVTQKAPVPGSAAFAWALALPSGFRDWYRNWYRGDWYRKNGGGKPGLSRRNCQPITRLQAEMVGFEPTVQFDPHTAFPVVNS